MTTYLVLDAEYAVDLAAHARYLSIERFNPDQVGSLHPRDERATPRWPFRRPVAISVLTMAVDADGVLSPVRLATFGQPEFDEATMMRHFHEEVARAGGTATLVTWGGATTDMPQLLATAMAHGLVLPETMRPLAQPFNVRARQHIDLMLALGGHGARCHMSEVAASLGIPAKVIGAPGAVAGYIEAGKWSLVKATAEQDVLTAALILVRYLGLSGGVGGLFATSDRIAAFAAAEAHRPYAADFTAYRRQLIANAFVEARIMHEVLAA